ncbi:hypothetical protein TRIATDRAFT_301699 [Trichoderma atroviride IMI 206040]|uniref:Uncharacterized protein n=1 Tax=Hypocrea atroviridis (strain ATCC 20476 / IMI 206040) TaxID=452589 RepID=G9P8N4_HYPAI|nr:uncharacterized protein TRIATDRAFT_301699 [Trichoderma atroviride IMI 206040]EHK40970.1 hypothetical protein TRIATDRAFT_301699 [Trichoderma atroviride IMI 206040]
MDGSIDLISQKKRTWHAHKHTMSHNKTALGCRDKKPFAARSKRDLCSLATVYTDPCSPFRSSRPPWANGVPTHSGAVCMLRCMR